VVMLPLNIPDTPVGLSLPTCADNGARGRRSKKGQETRLMLLTNFHKVSSWVDHGARAGGLADGF